MDLRSIMPFSWGGSTPSRRASEDGPFVNFRRQMDRLFDDFFAGRGLARWPRASGIDLAVDVSDTGSAIKVTAELPGVNEKDVGVNLTDDVLTIKGEKQAEKEEKGENVYVTERSYGAFSRSLRLPFSVDPDKVEAKFQKGVLIVTLPKPPEAQRPSKKIEVKSTS